MSDDHDPPRRHGRRAVRLAGVAVVALVLAGGAFAAWHWVRQQYFVGVDGEQVAVFRGLPQNLGPIDLASLDHTTGVLVVDLPPADRDSVRAGIVVDNSAQAAAKVAALRQAACGTTPAPATSNSPSPTGATTAAPRVSPAPGATPTASPRPPGSLPTQPTPTPSAVQASPSPNPTACIGGA